MAKDYKAVPCNFYDALESMATLKQNIDITFFNGEGKKISKQSSIKTLETKDKAEFLILNEGDKIRLDHITSITILYDKNTKKTD